MVRPLALHKGVSALPPKADMCGATRDVRFVPIADIDLFGGAYWASTADHAASLGPSTAAVLLSKCRYSGLNSATLCNLSQS